MTPGATYASLRARFTEWDTTSHTELERVGGFYGAEAKRPPIRGAAGKAGLADVWLCTAVAAFQHWGSVQARWGRKTQNSKKNTGSARTQIDYFSSSPPFKIRSKIQKPWLSSKQAEEEEKTCWRGEMANNSERRKYERLNHEKALADWAYFKYANSYFIAINLYFIDRRNW